MSKKKHYNKQPTQENEQGEAANLRVEEAMQEPEEKLDFDAWFVMREAQIPKAHHKEIIKADFRGRRLGQHETIKDFDAALAKYGIKLV